MEFKHSGSQTADLNPSFRRSEGLAIAAIATIAGPSLLPLATKAASFAESIGIVLLCAALVLAQPTDDRSHSETDRSFVGALLGAIVLVFAARGWIGGVPAYHHDWKWPLDALQASALPQQLSSIWLDWGSGAPAIQALGAYPATIATWLLCRFFPPPVALLAFLILLGGIAGFAIAKAARSLGLAPAYQLVLAAGYASMPAVFDRLAAGHTTWLLGYALFPLTIAIALNASRGSRAAGALGLVWGIAAGQLQFFAFFPLAAVPLLIRRNRLLVAVPALIIAAGLQACAIAATVFGNPVVAFASQRPNLYWQSAQSSNMLLSLISAADPAHYFSNSIHLPPWFSLPLLALAAVGAAQTKTMRALAITWIAAAIWSTGLDGPLAPAFAWSFVHIPSAFAFREFAHAQALVAAPLLLLAAIGCVAFGRRIPAAAAFAPALLALVMIPPCWPALGGELASAAPAAVVPPGLAAVTRRLASLPGDGQILWWPGLQPVSDQRNAGVDPEALPVGRHPPYSEYRPTLELVQVLRAFGRGDRAGCGLAADLGIQAVVVNDSLRLGADYGLVKAPAGPTAMRSAGLDLVAMLPAYRVYSVPCYRGRVTLAPVGLLAGDWTDLARAARRGATDEITTAPRTARACRIVPPPQSTYSSNDPGADWVPLTSLDGSFAEFGAAFAPPVVTSNPGASLADPLVLFAAPEARYEWHPLADFRRALRRGAVAVWETADDCRMPLAGASRIVQVARPLQSAPLQSARLHVFVTGTALLVVHEATGMGWNLSLGDERGARPVAADGFASGWIVPAGSRYVALFRTGPPTLVLWVIVSASLLLAIVLIARSGRPA